MNISNVILIVIIVLLVILLAAIPFVVRFRSPGKRTRRMNRQESRPEHHRETVAMRSSKEPGAGGEIETGTARLEEEEDLAAQVEAPARKNGRPH